MGVWVMLLAPGQAEPSGKTVIRGRAGLRFVLPRRAARPRADSTLRVALRTTGATELRLPTGSFLAALLAMPEVRAVLAAPSPVAEVRLGGVPFRPGDSVDGAGLALLMAAAANAAWLQRGTSVMKPTTVPSSAAARIAARASTSIPAGVSTRKRQADAVGEGGRGTAAVAERTGVRRRAAAPVTAESRS
ncbi:hypothetical protein [Geodermatophilus sp. SYSU D01176]